MSSPASTYATYAAYAAIALALAAWQGISVVRGSLTFGQLLGWLREKRAVRILLVLGWAWLGWHLFARGDASFLH
jgi:hypothetical protein